MIGSSRHWLKAVNAKNPIEVSRARSDNSRHDPTKQIFAPYSRAATPTSQRFLEDGDGRTRMESMDLPDSKVRTTHHGTQVELGLWVDSS